MQNKPLMQMLKSNCMHLCLQKTKNKKIPQKSVSLCSIMPDCTHFFKTLHLLYAGSKKCLQPLYINYYVLYK